MSSQNSWLECSKCASMFYNGNPFKGVCPAGGAHTGQNPDYDLDFDIPQSATSQASWRFCQKCEALFFAGNPLQGICKAGGEHSAQGLNFVLPHDIPLTSGTRNGWRFCQKCFVMFFEGSPTQACAVGGKHQAQGFDFVLPFGQQVPDPTSGLGSNSNYFLDASCNPIKSLAIYVDVTEEIVCTGIGWSIQVNCYSPKDKLCAWQQYVFGIANIATPEVAYGQPSRTYINAIVNNWPETGNYLINTGTVMTTTPQFGTIPAAYRFVMTISTDENQNVSAIAYDLLDNLGNRVGNSDTQLLQIPGVTAADLAPIIAFQVNIVGPFNGLPAQFSSGAGTITCTSTQTLEVLNTEPSCAESGYITAETANTFYGPLPPTPTGAPVQWFHVSATVPMIEKVGKPRPPLNNMMANKE